MQILLLCLYEPAVFQELSYQRFVGIYRLPERSKEAYMARLSPHHPGETTALVFAVNMNSVVRATGTNLNLYINAITSSLFRLSIARNHYMF